MLTLHLGSILQLLWQVHILVIRSILNSSVVQVVGRKSVWLAPPTVSRSMSSYAEASYSGTNSSDEPGMSNGVLSNTSRIDVFSDYRTTNRNMSSDYALFQETVVPEAMSTILEPGDVLFFPPGWWHAMRSETVSFSVSMWF